MLRHFVHRMSAIRDGAYSKLTLIGERCGRGGFKVE